MTGRRAWDPERDLATLLDALSEELLAASDREVTLLARETQPDMMVRDMRRLILAAEADLALPASGFTSSSLRAYLSRNQ